MKPLEGVAGFSMEAKKCSHQGKCREYAELMAKEMKKRFCALLKPRECNVDGTVFVFYPVGRAFCQFKVPCMARNPMAKWQKTS